MFVKVYYIGGGGCVGGCWDIIIGDCVGGCWDIIIGGCVGGVNIC